jgi:hypothetical protein
VSRAGLGIAVILCSAAVGCGGGSHRQEARNPAVGQGRAIAGCETKIGGSGGYGWRQDATAVGRFGVFGSGRDFRTAQKQPVRDFPALQQRHVSGPILATKTPFVVEGGQPVEVAIAPADRSRAGLIVAPFAGPGAGSYAEVRFVPCRDQLRTWWAGGWALRDQRQVTVSIQPQNGPESHLVVGRP